MRRRVENITAVLVRPYCNPETVSQLKLVLGGHNESQAKTSPVPSGVKSIDLPSLTIGN